MFEFLKRRKKESVTQEETSTSKASLPSSLPQTGFTPEKEAPAEEPKLDLLLTRIESLKLQYEAMKEKVENIERMVKELYQMAKS